MDQPLGYAVGNALEVREAIDTLMGKGPEDFLELCLTLGSEMVVAGKKADSTEEARKMLLEKLEDGSALDKLAQFVRAQGGDDSYVYHPDKLPVAEKVYEVKAEKDGFLSHIDCDEVGICSLILGGGRETKESPIDLSVGLILNAKTGAAIHKGDTLATLYGNDEHKLQEAARRYLHACHISDTCGPQTPFIKGIIR